MYAGPPQPCLLDGLADRGGRGGRAVHAHHDRAAAGVGAAGHLAAPGTADVGGIPRQAGRDIRPAGRGSGIAGPLSWPVTVSFDCHSTGRRIGPMG